jgi:hypothetical protein
MENNIESTELEQMRTQLNLLKEKLEKETIVNERLIRKAMKEKVSNLNRDAIAITIVALLGIPYCTFVFANMMNMSWWFIGTTDVFFLIAVIDTYISHKDIRAKELMDGNLIEVSRKIERMRRMYANWLKFGIPFIIVWFAWFLFEALGRNVDDGAPIAIGGAIGGIIGACIGIRKYRQTRRKTLEVIMQIKELNEAS